MPFENLFTDYEAYAKFVLTWLLFPLLNNGLHFAKFGKIQHPYYLMIPIPRWLGAIMLLFPRKHYGYRVQLFLFISQSVFVLSMGVLAVLSLMGARLSPELQTAIPKYMVCFAMIMAVCAIIDSTIYDRNHPDEIADLLRKSK